MNSVKTSQCVAFVAQYGAMSKMAVCCAAACWPTERIEFLGFFCTAFLPCFRSASFELLSVFEIKARSNCVEGSKETAPHSTCSATWALPLRPSITDALLLAEVASRGSFDFGTGPFIFLFFSNRTIFVADRPEGSAHFDSAGFCSAFWLAGSFAPLCFLYSNLCLGFAGRFESYGFFSLLVDTLI